MEKNDEKKGIDFKAVRYYILNLFVVAFLVCYYYFGWILQVQRIHRNLDATIRGLCTVIIAAFLGSILNHITKKIKLEDHRQRTILSLVNSMISYALVIVALILVLTYFIEDTSSLFTGLGMLSMVIGLGCNKLIADVVAGIFIIMEGDFQVGDKVVINGTKGDVESIGIRSTKILDYANNLKIINNSSISSVTNWSATSSGAMIEVGIDYDESIERVEQVLAENLPKFKEEIKGINAGPFYKGVVELGDSAVIIRIIAFVDDENRSKVKRAMLRKIKILFDENHIAFPYPQMTISKR